MSTVFSNSGGDLRIAVIPANPDLVDADALESECELIRETLDIPAESVQFQSFLNDRRPDIRRSLRKFGPSALHFTSRGIPDGPVVMPDYFGYLRKVRLGTVENFFSDLQIRPDCIFLNGCTLQGNNAKRPHRIATLFEFSQIIPDADLFDTGIRAFYSTLRSSQSYSEAFELLQSSPLFGDVSTGLRLGWSSPTRQFEVGEQVTDTYEVSGSVLDDEQAVPITEQGGLFAVGKEIASPQIAKGKGKSPGTLYRTWFGTDRELLDLGDPSKGFGSDRASQIYYGYCDVSIPKSHKIGTIDDGWIKRWAPFVVNNRIAVRKLALLQPADYWQKLSSYFSELEASDRVLLVYIHGYKTTFENAAIRAAQIGFDLSVRGATAFYSWPSKGAALGYLADGAAVEASANALRQFIVDMAGKSGASAVHLIVHSMGNRGFLRAFQNVLSGMRLSPSIPIKQLILAAPDVDVGLFKQLADIYGVISSRATMYVSGSDRALALSKALHAFQRAGFAPPVTVVDGVDTIEVSKVDFSLLGHGFYAEAERVLTDMRALMETSASPVARTNLALASNSNGQNYWIMK